MKTEEYHIRLVDLRDSIDEFLRDEGKTVKRKEWIGRDSYILIEHPVYYGGIEIFLGSLKNSIQSIACLLKEDKSTKKARRKISASLRKRVLERDKYRCVNPKCSSFKDLAIDHTKPIDKGGTDDIGNLRTLCKSCNSAKKNKDALSTF